MKIRRILALILCLAALSGCALPGLGLEDEPVITDAPAEEPDSQVISGTNRVNNRFSLSYVSDKGVNPFTTSSTMNLLFAPLIYETLFTLNERFEPSPCLVTDWYSNDNIYWYFTVDTSVRFHDGSNLTAYDAAYSLLRARYSGRYKSRLAKIAGVSALDDNEFVVRLDDRYPSTQLPELLDIPVIKYDSVGSLTPPGTGPYKLSEDERRLELFSEHRDAMDMPIDTIFLRDYVSVEDTIAAFESADIDLVMNDPTGPSNLGYGGANEIRYFNTNAMHYIAFNSESPFFQFPINRIMVGFAIDRQRIVTEIMGGAGVASTLPINPASNMYNAAYAETLAFSPDKFKNCLNTANIQDHDNDGALEYMITGIPMEIDLTFIVNNESAVKVAAARQIAGVLLEAGITVTLRELGWEDYTAALYAGDFDMYYGETILTADYDIGPLIVEGGSLNYGGHKDPSYVSLVVEYLNADEQQRQTALQMLLNYVADTGAIIPIAFEKRQVITSRNLISDMLPTAANVFYNFKDWTINLGE